MSELKVMRTLDPKAGDTKYTWDPSKKDEVEGAKEHFKQMRAKGYVAYTLDKHGEKKSVAVTFEDVQGAAQVVFAPRPNGG